MITTGQLPTPLPPMPGIIAGESRSMQRLAARVNGQSQKMPALPPPTPRTEPRRGETAARMPALLPPTPRTEPRRGETAARMPALPPPTPRTEPRRGETAARMPALPPMVARAQPPGAETEPRLNQRSRPLPQVVETEAWVNAPPPITPQGGAVTGWMNASPEAQSPRRTGDLQHPGTEPLVRPTLTGSRSMTGPRPPVRNADEPRRRIAEQKTLIGAEPGFASGSRNGKQEEVDRGLGTRAPERQFLAPPRARSRPQPEEANNPHPSRSLWHYTDKHPAVKGKKHVQE